MFRRKEGLLTSCQTSPGYTSQIPGNERHGGWREEGQGREIMTGAQDVTHLKPLCIFFFFFHFWLFSNLNTYLDCLSP